MAAPRAGAGDEEVGLDRAVVGLDRMDAVVADVEARDLDALEEPHALGTREPAEVLDGLVGLRPAALPLVQHGVDPLAVPVGEDRLHVLLAGLLAEDHVRAVADLRLLLLDCDAVLGLHLRHRRDVADRVVAEAGGIRLEQLDRDADHLGHRRREVEVADDAARDTRGAGGEVLLLEDDDVAARALTRFLERLRDVVGARKTMDSAAEDDVRCGFGKLFLAHNGIALRATLLQNRR